MHFIIFQPVVQVRWARQTGKQNLSECQTSLSQQLLTLSSLCPEGSGARWVRRRPGSQGLSYSLSQGAEQVWDRRGSPSPGRWAPPWTLGQAGARDRSRPRLVVGVWAQAVGRSQAQAVSTIQDCTLAAAFPQHIWEPLPTSQRLGCCQL